MKKIFLMLSIIIGVCSLTAQPKILLDLGINFAKPLSNFKGYRPAIGSLAGSLSFFGENNIMIGFNAQVPNVDFSNQIRIGNTITYAGVQVA